MHDCKSPDILANEIFSLASILKVYCENYAADNHEISCIEFLAEYIYCCANDLAKIY